MYSFFEIYLFSLVRQGLSQHFAYLLFIENIYFFAADFFLLNFAGYYVWIDFLG